MVNRSWIPDGVYPREGGDLKYGHLVVPLWRGRLPHCPPLEGVQGEVWKLIEIIYAATTNAYKKVQTPYFREGGELNDRLFTSSSWFKLLL
jgi:hypothetical protein